MMHRGSKRAKLKIGKPSTVRFNIMVVGETGSGKTTFLKTLFKAYCGSDIIRNELCSKTVKTVKIEEIGCFVLDTPALDCEVHLFDSPGYGDYINNQDAIETVKTHLENAHKSWFETNGNQMTEQRRNAADKRIHCVFYFIAPHRIKDIDKEFIKQLTGLAPIVLVVAKADTMTWHERKDHLIAVKELVKELTSICNLPIAFDFQEDDQGFMDDVITPSPRSWSPPSVGLHSTYTYNDDLDLTSSMVEEHEEEEQHGRQMRFVPTGACASADASYVHSVGASPFQPSPFRADFSAQSADTSGPAALATPTTSAAARVPSPVGAQSPVHCQLHPPLPKIRNAFAVVCDTSESGKREYPWGSLDIYDEEHSDFRRLQRLVFESNHITDLRELTQQMSMIKYNPLCASDKDSKKVIRDVMYYLDRVTKVALVLRKVLHIAMLTTCWTVLALFVLQYLLNNDTAAHTGTVRLVKILARKLITMPLTEN